MYLEKYLADHGVKKKNLKGYDASRITRPNVSHEAMCSEKHLKDHEVRENTQSHEALEVTNPSEICD